ncbi:MAG: hypothetical protein VX320_00195 [Candidatus Thermoplasmatota archaeon]|nr:hypothetical protein [Candidatus Thermoplasmatota archaeon]
MDAKKILNAKWWLIITALAHAIVGTLLQTEWDNDTSMMVGGFMLLTSFTMLYAAFMTEGQDQARLAVVIAGPVFVWFVVSIAMGLEWQIGDSDTTKMTLANNIPPLIIWGMTALCGVMGWNSNE